MRVLVTGANGLVGGYVVTKLLEIGFQVRVLVRRKTDKFPSQVEVFEGDITDSITISDAVSNCDAVVHCAAIISFWPSMRDVQWKTNVDGTRHLIDAMLYHQIPVLVHISSIAAIGRNKQIQIIKESQLWEESSDNSFYAKTKYEAELEVFRGFEEGIQGIILNPSIILGPGKKDSGSTRLFDYVLKGSTFYTKGNLHYVDVRDVADAVAEVLVKKLFTQERYILNAGTISYQSFFNQIAVKAGVKAPSVEASNWMKALAWRVEAVKSWFTQKEPTITKETAKTASGNYIYNSDKIKQLLTFPKYRLEDSISYTLDILKARQDFR
ncbi:MAG: NAD-dependent epimerase/dehydratase family protein [Cytophagaceae bacterium]